MDAARTFISYIIFVVKFGKIIWEQNEKEQKQKKYEKLFAW
jgi:hypothetical protein